MRAKSFKGMACSIAGTLELVGDRWAFLLLRDLSLGLTRYDAFRQSTGIPPNTLADRLRHLEAGGLVEKRVYQERPPRQEYVLTDKGRDFWIVIAALAQWGDRWDASGCGAPPMQLVDGDSGRAVRLMAVDAETGEAVPPDRLVATAGPGADDLAHWRFSTPEREA